MIVDLSKPISQSEFAILVNASRQAISKACKKGILPKGATAGVWLAMYCDNLRNVSAGWEAKGGLNLVQERANLTRLQAVRLALELKQSRREFWPIHAIVESMSATTLIVRNKLLSLHHRIKSRINYIKPVDVELIHDLVRECLNELGNSRLPKEIEGRIRAIRDREWKQLGAVQNENETIAGRPRKGASKKAGTNKNKRIRKNMAQAPKGVGAKSKKGQVKNG